MSLDLADLSKIVLGTFIGGVPWMLGLVLFARAARGVIADERGARERIITAFLEALASQRTDSLAALERLSSRIDRLVELIGGIGSAGSGGP